MSRAKFFLFVVVAGAVVLAFPHLAFAQDAAVAEGGGTTLGDNISQSMPIGGVLILLSIASLGLIIEHFVSIRREKVIPSHLVEELDGLIEEEAYEDAVELCEREPGFISNVIGQSLPRMSQGYEAMAATMQQIGEEEAVKLQNKIGYLSLIASLGPMLGLFGTVTGMITAFNQIADSGGNANAAQLAGGISMALMTTAMGLVVALPAVAFYFVFKAKVTRLVLEAGVICSDLVDRFRPVEA